MLKKIFAGAALAAVSTLAMTGTASAEPAPRGGGDLLQTAPGVLPQDGGSTGSANELVRLPNADTGFATGLAGDFSTRYGDAAVARDSSGIANTHGAPLVNVDARCAVPNPDVQYIGGTLFGGNRAGCNTAPVTQAQGDKSVL
ncbi:hypothetical protein ACF07T_39700 [Streptomyces sp. NPDC015184]|uniref:hypothetical protein n=1 Tax=Streptomyces sp. NPDC015184 TaxID=3364946 RepID=UPI0036FCD4A2